MKKIQFLTITMLLSFVCVVDAKWGGVSFASSNSGSSKVKDNEEISTLVANAQVSLSRLKDNLSAEARDALVAFRSDLKSLKKAVKSLSMAKKIAAQVQVKVLRDQFKEVLGLSDKVSSLQRPDMKIPGRGDDDADDVDA